MKIGNFLFIVFLMTSGCDATVTEKGLEPWKEVCEAHGGLKFVKWNAFITKPKLAECNDGMLITSLPDAVADNPRLR